MRWIPVLVLIMPLLAQGGVVNARTDQRLCQAARMTSGLPARVNRLLGNDRMAFADAPDLLELQCGERTLMQILLDERRAENLEYVVIDLGVSLDQKLETGSGAMTLRGWLERKSREHGDAQVREFARGYLKRFQDASFNPNLLVSAQ